MDDDTVLDFESIDDPTESDSPAERDGAFATGRFITRTYASRSFILSGRGVPGRFVNKVFDTDDDRDPEGDEDVYDVYESPKGRAQLKLLVSREAGHVSHLWFQRIKTVQGRPLAENVVSLERADATRLVELIKTLEVVPVEGGETVRVDDALVRDLFASPESITDLYRREPELFRKLITSDAAAKDVVALERRRKEVERFKALLYKDEYFNEQVANAPGQKPERVWQNYFEENPWVLGTGLAGQLYTSWDASKLEQVVGGASIVEVGKRTDALMRTSGRVRWLTFAEFKTHRTALLGGRYRPGTYPPSAELVGGVAQSQATVRRALRDIDGALRGTDEEGGEVPGDVTFATRPRSFLVVGHLGELLNSEGNPVPPKIRSFELFRQSLTEPEVVTFDELLARAEWSIEVEDSD